MTGIDASGFFFIGTHAVYAAHENVSEYCAVNTAQQYIQIELKARIAFNSRHIDGNDGNLLHSCLGKGTADETYIVGGTAAASGLGHDDGDLI